MSLETKKSFSYIKEHYEMVYFEIVTEHACNIFHPITILSSYHFLELELSEM